MCVCVCVCVCVFDLYIFRTKGLPKMEGLFLKWGVLTPLQTMEPHLC